MSYANLMLGGSIFFLVATGFLASFQAVNGSIPPRISRGVMEETQSASKEDRLQPKEIAIKQPHDAATETEPHLNRLCTSLEGKPFGWDWPNVPFATMTCDIQRRK
jgi:hypothetical protein